MFNTNFRIIKKGSTSDADVFLMRCDIPAAPTSGETININGNPYLVKDRSWAVDDEFKLFCYIRLLPLGEI